MFLWISKNFMLPHLHIDCLKSYSCNMIGRAVQRFQELSAGRISRWIEFFGEEYCADEAEKF